MTLIKTIQIKGNNYTTKFPTVGQFIDINVLESQLSKGTSKDLLGGTPDAVDSYIYISTYAHFKVLFPKLIEDLKVPILDLDLRDFEELTRAFLEIRQWINEVRNSVHKELESDGEFR